MHIKELIVYHIPHMKVSETEKIYLKRAFNEMLDKGESCCTVETLEVDWEHGCDVRKIFRIVIEQGIPQEIPITNWWE